MIHVDAGATSGAPPKLRSSRQNLPTAAPQTHSLGVAISDVTLLRRSKYARRARQNTLAAVAVRRQVGQRGTAAPLRRAGANARRWRPPPLPSTRQRWGKPPRHAVWPSPYRPYLVRCPTHPDSSPDNAAKPENSPQLGYLNSLPGCSLLPSEHAINFQGGMFNKLRSTFRH